VLFVLVVYMEVIWEPNTVSDHINMFFMILSGPSILRHSIEAIQETHFFDFIIILDKNLVYYSCFLE
jgi:hypothetical protein